MKRGIYFLLIAALLVVPIASAEIFIGQPDNGIYNLGDDFEVNLTLNSNLKKSDFLTTSLVCGEKKIELYKSIHSLDAGMQKSITINFGIDKTIIGDVLGECIIEAVYGNDKASTSQFTITNKIDINFNIEGIAFGPNDVVKISGRAIKLNERLFGGYTVIDIKEINLSSIQLIEEGKFNSTFIIPDNAPPGNYEINVKAYEKEGDNIINEGQSTSLIKIKQIIKKIKIDISNLIVVPGNDFYYTIYLFDQSEGSVEKDIQINILSPDKSSFYNGLIKSNIANKIHIENNYAPGYWNIESSINDLKDSKLFLVDELEKAEFRLENNTLIINNIGNVPYKKPIEVSIGGVVNIKEMNLDVGKNKLLKLGAPDGEYSISINDGNLKEELGTTFLTGRAIGVGDIESIVFGEIGLWIWSALIIILIIIILILWRKITKKNYFGKTPKIISPIRSEEFNYKKPDIPAIGPVLDKGIKQEAGIIALKIKNLADLQKNASGSISQFEKIDKTLLQAKEAGAKIYVDNDYRIIIFAPAVTKEQENQLRSIIIAKEIEKNLQEFNKISQIKINFGIGVHTGQIAVETDAGKFKFVSLENTIAISKRIAEESYNSVLLSEPMHKKTLGKIKADKIYKGNYWILKQVIDRSDYQYFIKRFLDRQKREQS